MNKVC